MQRWIVAACLWLAPVAAIADETAALEQVQASPDDCAVFAVLGKAKLGWSQSAPPEGNYIAESTISKGDSSDHMGPPQKYVAQCAWHELGLADHVSNPQGGRKHYALGRPIYVKPEQAHATWNRFEFVSADGRVELHHHFQLCKFAKQNGQWQLETCDAEQDVIRDSHPEKP